MTTRRPKAGVVAAREAVTATAAVAATIQATVRVKAATQKARSRARTKRSAPCMSVFKFCKKSFQDISAFCKSPDTHVLNLSDVCLRFHIHG